MKEEEGRRTRYVCKFFLFKHITNYLVPASSNLMSPCPHQHHPAPRQQRQPKYTAKYDNTPIWVCFHIRQCTFLLPPPNMNNAPLWGALFVIGGLLFPYLTPPSSHERDAPVGISFISPNLQSECHVP